MHSRPIGLPVMLSAELIVFTVLVLWLVLSNPCQEDHLEDGGRKHVHWSWTLSDTELSRELLTFVLEPMCLQN